MRNEFWNMLIEIKRCERYYWHYKIHSEKVLRGLNAFIGFASCAGIASLAIWKNLWFIWGAIVAIAQALGAIQHLLPYSKQITSISYLLPDLDKLINEINYVWGTIDELSDKEINDLIFKYRNEFVDLESKYVGNTFFPEIPKCSRKSDNETDAYIGLIHPDSISSKEDQNGEIKS